MTDPTPGNPPPELPDEPDEELAGDLTEEDLPWFPIAVVFYFPLAVACAGWIGAREGTDELIRRLVGPSPLGDLGLGVATGLLVAALSWGLERTWPEARRLADAFVDVVRGLTPFRCLALAVLSSAGEELLFRGVLQPAWGLWPAALLFASLHFPAQRRFLLWPVFALAAGLLFGLLFERTGSLPGPFAAHAAVNGVNLLRLAGTRRASETGVSDPGAA